MMGWAIAAAVYAWAAGCWWAIMEPEVKSRWAVVAISIGWPITCPLLVWWRDHIKRLEKRRKIEVMLREIRTLKRGLNNVIEGRTDNDKAD